MEDGNNILADIPSEGGKVDFTTDAPEKKDEESDSPTDTKTEETDKPSQGGDNSPDDANLPFHKHPRWKQMYEKASKVEGLESQLSEMKSTLEKLQSGKIDANSQEAVPEWFVELYGENPKAYKIMKEKMLGGLKNEIFAELDKRREAESSATAESEKYVKSALSAMKDDGIEFEENELMKFIVNLKDKYGMYPVDDQNRIDFRKAYQMMTELTPAKSDGKKTSQSARKSIAGFTTKGSSGKPDASGGKEYMTSKDLRHTDWRSLID
jgi:hypothetical protein